MQRRPHEFKIACLEDIRALFPPEWNPFYAGFGNRDTDVVSYREVGVPPGRTFIINPKGQISKGTSGVQSSTWSSLSAINTLVDEVFPAVQVGARARARLGRGPKGDMSERFVRMPLGVVICVCVCLCVCVCVCVCVSVHTHMRARARLGWWVLEPLACSLSRPPRLRPARPLPQEMLYIMKGASGGMRAAAKAIMAAELLRHAHSGADGGAAGEHESEQQQ